MGGRKDIRLCMTSRIYGTSFEATHWRSLDPCGCLGVTATLSVHLFAYFTAAIYLVEGSMLSTAVFVLLYTPIAVLAISSLFMAWSTDPGAVPLGARPLVTLKRAGSREDQALANSQQRAMRRCPKCGENFKPSRAHHDSVTGRCIVKFDHFCPWIGNAVGALNHKFFVLFVGYTMCSCILSLIMLFLRAMYCGGWTSDGLPKEGGRRRLLAVESREECYGFYNSYATLALLIVAVVFMIFTFCMLIEQIDAIQTNSSKIARMKMRVGQGGTELARVTEEFNEMFGGTSNAVAWHWFLPLEVRFPRGMKKVVLGYEWDETFDAVPYEEPSFNHGSTMTVGGAGTDEETGLVELTRVPSTAALPGVNGVVFQEEGTSTATPQLPEKEPRLIQRASSGSRLESRTGSMT